jgi:SAM-dependent methyltransferase
MWTPAFACPACRAALTVAGVQSRCLVCGQTYQTGGRILRLITPERVGRAAPFLSHYHAIRRRDGHGVMTVEDYRRLPEVAPDHSNALEWRIRRESWLTLRQLLRSRDEIRRHAATAALRTLDAGAGNGWLSNRLCEEGHVVAAMDINDDAVDGLGACGDSAHQFPAIQGDFDALPFTPGQFDLVIMNASLHYAADPGRTLAEAARTALPNAALVVMDSPIVSDTDQGEAMVARQFADLRERVGIAPVRTGLGYLTLSLLQQAAAQLDKGARFFVSRGPLRWRFGRARARWQQGRVGATFGVWVAQ